MRFCTVVNCMDGRVQLPVISYLQKRFKVMNVDCITEAGPNLILAENKNIKSIRSIFDRLKISIENHKSVGVAVIGHYDCAGNPAPKEEQIQHIQTSVKQIRKKYDSIEVIGLWVDREWKVREVTEN